jgi:mannose-6-phosphate isomerase-like protein (cupin superfamily)
VTSCLDTQRSAVKNRAPHSLQTDEFPLPLGFDTREMKIVASCWRISSNSRFFLVETRLVTSTEHRTDQGAEMAISRRSLIRSSLVAAPLVLGEAIVPIYPRAEVPNADPNAWFWFPGHGFCMKATGKDTGGTSAWMMAENGPHQGGPFHKHKNEDESFLVVEGTFEITVGDKTSIGGPGTYALVPGKSRIDGRTLERAAVGL